MLSVCSKIYYMHDWAIRIRHILYYRNCSQFSVNITNHFILFAVYIAHRLFYTAMISGVGYFIGPFAVSNQVAVLLCCFELHCYISKGSYHVNCHV